MASVTEESVSDVSEESEQGAVEDVSGQNSKNLKIQMAYHFVAFVSAAVLWGAADSWSVVSGLGVAHFFLLLSSVVFGVVLSHIAHEWSHFLGALKSGSDFSVKENPAILFFDFDFSANTRQQFLSMSMGGSVGNIALIVLVCLLIPFDSAGRGLLLATVVAMAVYVAVLEWAVIRRAKAGEDPLTVLADHFGQGPVLFDRAIRYAVISGLGLWFLLGFFI